MGRVALTATITVALGALLLYLSGMQGSEKYIVIALTAVFFLIALWATVRNVQYYGRLKSALKTKYVDCDVSILGRSISTRRARRTSVFIEVVIGDDIRRGQLMGLNGEHKHIGNKGSGKAWRCPDTGMPMQFLFEGKKFRPIPEIQLVDPDSFIEKHVVEPMKRDGTIVG